MSNSSKKTFSTFEKEMKNSEFKKTFQESYKDFLISELLLTMMEKNRKSVN